MWNADFFSFISANVSCFKIAVFPIIQPGFIPKAKHWETFSLKIEALNLCHSWWVSGSKKFRLLFHFSYCLASYLASLKPKTRQRCKPSAAYGHPAATCVPAVGFGKAVSVLPPCLPQIKRKKAQKPVSLMPVAHPAVFVPVVLLALSGS